jgi:hypothetical protein
VVNVSQAMPRLLPELPPEPLPELPPELLPAPPSGAPPPVGEELLHPASAGSASRQTMTASEVWTLMRIGEHPS